MRHRKRTPAFNQGEDLSIGENIAYEREFKLQVLDWLNNG
jgi:hypothetical protein